MIPVNKIPEVDLQQLKSDRDHEEVAAIVDSEEAVEEKKILAIIKKMEEVKEVVENPNKAIYTVEENPNDEEEEAELVKCTIVKVEEETELAKHTIVEVEAKKGGELEVVVDETVPSTPVVIHTTEEVKDSEPTVEVHSFTSFDNLILPLKNKYYRGCPEGPSAEQQLLDKYIKAHMYKRFRKYHEKGIKIQQSLEMDLREIHEDRLRTYTEKYIRITEEFEEWADVEREEENFVLNALDVKCVHWQIFLEQVAANIGWFRTQGEKTAPHWPEEKDEELAEALKTIADDIDRQRSTSPDFSEEDFMFAHEVAPFEFMESIRYSIFWN